MQRNLPLRPPAATTYLDSTPSLKGPLMQVNASERSRCSTATNTELGTLHAGTPKDFTLSLLGTSLPLCRQARGDEGTAGTLCEEKCGSRRAVLVMIYRLLPSSPVAPTSLRYQRSASLPSTTASASVQPACLHVPKPASRQNMCKRPPFGARGRTMI